MIKEAIPASIVIEIIITQSGIDICVVVMKSELTDKYHKSLDTFVLTFFLFLSSYLQKVYIGGAYSI